MAYIGKKPTDAALTSSDIADGIITTAKIADSQITSAKITDGAIVNADVNASAAIAGSKLSGAGISESDQWRLTGGFTSNQDPISSNLERVDDGTWGKLGTGMSVSSGIFTFPSTGLWLVKGSLNGNTYDDNYTFNIFGTADNSSYDQLAYANGGNNYSDTDYFQITLETLFNCTDVSTHKVKFTTDGMAGSGNTQVFVSSTANLTYFSFTRLGDSV